MTSDEEKDPPVPAFLEGISLKRVHDGQGTENHDSGDTTSPQAEKPDS
ncbi:hypothetical protein ACX80N_14895 [Arthrobacter sp. MDT2-16]|nr:hypothetical protein [Arthrobacter ruber]